MTQANAPVTALTQARRWAARLVSLRVGSWTRVALVRVGLAALVVYVLPGLLAPAAHWPLWDVRVYWWGGQQATACGGALYAPGAPFIFTYPPFAALLFAVLAGASIGLLKAVLTVGSVAGLAVLSGLSLGAAGVRRRAESVFAVSAIGLLTWPVGVHAAPGRGQPDPGRADRRRRAAPIRRRLVAGDRDGAGRRDQADPLIFVAYLALTVPQGREGLVRRVTRSDAFPRKPAPRDWAARVRCEVAGGVFS